MYLIGIGIDHFDQYITFHENEAAGSNMHICFIQHLRKIILHKTYSKEIFQGEPR